MTWSRTAGREVVATGRVPMTTNNRMELRGVIEGLNGLDPTDITVVSDSRYIVDGFTKWLPKWKQNGWRTTAGPVKNDDLWRGLEEAVERHASVRFVWARGHAGNVGNELANTLAEEQAAAAADAVY